MKYSINIKSTLSLKVCVGEFDTFEEAKAQTTKFIVDLIDKQKNELLDPWENLKEGFPEEIQGILNSYEESGTADFDGCIDYKDGNISYYANERHFDISGKRVMWGYNLSIATNAINMYEPDEDYHFTLTEKHDDKINEITIELHVDDRTVEVRNIIPDGALEYVDLDD